MTICCRTKGVRIQRDSEGIPWPYSSAYNFPDRFVSPVPKKLTMKVYLVPGLISQSLTALTVESFLPNAVTASSLPETSFLHRPVCASIFLPTRSHLLACILLACSLKILSEAGESNFVEGVTLPLRRRSKFPQEFF